MKHESREAKASLPFVLLRVSESNRHLLQNLPFPLFAKEGNFTSLWQREERRDFTKQCRHYYETVNKFWLILHCKFTICIDVLNRRFSWNSSYNFLLPVYLWEAFMP